jgi:hypothetical protein
LCKDLGRRFDHYETKLLRIERSRAAQQTYVGGDGGDGGEGVYDGEGGEAYGGWNTEADYQETEEGYNVGYTAITAGVGASDTGSFYRNTNAPAPHKEVDKGFGSSHDRFAAPNVHGAALSPEREAGMPREDDFADADLSDLLTD